MYFKQKGRYHIRNPFSTRSDEEYSLINARNDPYFSETECKGNRDSWRKREERKMNEFWFRATVFCMVLIFVIFTGRSLIKMHSGDDENIFPNYHNHPEFTPIENVYQKEIADGANDMAAYYHDLEFNDVENSNQGNDDDFTIKNYAFYPAIYDPEYIAAEEENFVDAISPVTVSKPNEEENFEDVISPITVSKPVSNGFENIPEKEEEAEFQNEKEEIKNYPNYEEEENFDDAIFPGIVLKPNEEGNFDEAISPVTVSKAVSDDFENEIFNPVVSEKEEEEAEFQNKKKEIKNYQNNEKIFF